MTTPAGHSLLGLAIFLGAAWGRLKRPLLLVVLVLAAATAADIDLLPALWGDLELAKAWHQGWTHSLLFGVAVAAALAAAGAALGCGSFPRLLALLAVASCSHLLLDMLCVDTREPVGVMLFWPWEGRLISPVPLFDGLAKDSVADLFSAHNALAVLREVLLLSPLVLAAWLLSLRRKSRAAGGLRKPDSTDVVALEGQEGTTDKENGQSG